MFLIVKDLRVAAFNQKLSRWDVSNSENFAGMFSGATAFDQDLSRWDVSNSERFAGMFLGAKAFDQDLSRWDVSHGTNFNAITVYLHETVTKTNITGFLNWSHNTSSIRCTFFKKLP